MNLSRLGAYGLSFEVFPPKKEEDFPDAYTVLDRLGALSPDFISVTYGAGGSKSKKTVELAGYIQNRLRIPALAHLTCVGAKTKDVEEVVLQLKAAGIQNVLALRGDRPAWMGDAQYESRDFAHALDLIQYLKSHTDLQIAGACYPEGHFEAVSFEDDIRHLKEKEEAGAQLFLSQLFFQNDFFYRFLDAARRAGVTAPICAGIMPITSAKQLGSSVSLSGSSVPRELSECIANHADRPEEMRKAGADYAIRQILDLQKHGVDGIHLYTMNRARTTEEIVGAVYPL